MRCGRCGFDADGNARFCSQCGAPLGHAAADVAERRHATIVFSDLSGYTALNERLDPEDVEEILGRDDAARAVRAVLQLHRAVRALSAQFEARAGGPIAMHSGINTGLVIARRSDDRAGRFQLTGDSVNTASRLLALAADGEIVVSQETWRELGGRFDGQARPAVEVKGKGRPVPSWLVLGERAAEPPPARGLFGRRAERDRFEAAARACATQRRGRIVMLRGDPGIGKTRLAEECTRRAADLGFATHRALVLDFSAERGTDAVRSLARGLAAFAPPAPAAREHEVFLASLLDTDLGPELRALAAAMSEAVRAQGTRAALCSLARDAARRQPQLLLVEDLHWADAWTLDHLVALAELAGSEPIVLLATTRREADPTPLFEGRAALDVLDLGPLETGDMRALAAQFGDVPASAAEALVARAEGNPLFLEQLLLNTGESARHDLPGSIQGLVLARMDRLPPGDRAALQAASVLGQRFSLDVLRWLLDDAGQDARVLLEHHLIRRDGDSCLFWHALIRDGAYAALLKSRRRQLHARAAAWYQERDPALAAEHLERAEDPAAAAAYRVAGAAEAARYRYERALGLIDRGLALARTDADRHALFNARGHALHELGRADEAIDAWRQALAGAPDDAARCRALIGIAAGMRLVDRATEGLEQLALAEPLAIGPAMALERSRLHHLRGNLCFGLGRIDDCLREHQAALASAIECGSEEAEANALGGLGDAYYLRGRLRSAHDQFGRCVELARRGGFGRIEVANLHMVGWTAHALNRFRQALEVSDECLRLARAVSHRRVEMIARALVIYIGGWILGDVAEARRQLEIAMPLVSSLGAARFEGQARTYHAQIVLREGDRAHARILAHDALAFCRRHGMAFFGPVALGLAARLSDDPGECAACNAEALALLDAGSISHSHLEYYSHAIEGALERAAWAEAEQYCDRLARYTAEEPLELTEFQIARGRVLIARGRGDRGPAIAGRLAALTRQARAEELHLWRPALESAYAEVQARTE